jgi:hypothetical protein
MSDNNPLKKALDKSKAFLAVGKTRSSKDQPNTDNDDNDDHAAAAHTSYDRRQRILSSDETRNQLDLGENGWNGREWAKIKQNREQKTQRGSSGPFATPSRENDNMHSGSPSNSQTNYSTPQGGTPQRGTPQRDTPQRGTPQRDTPQRDTPQQRATPTQQATSNQQVTPNSGSATQRSGGSREHFNRPLAFRTAQYQGLQSSPNEGIPTPHRSQDNPLRTRIAGPSPNVDLSRSGRYNRHGVRVSSAEREREAYLTSQGFGVTGERSQQGNEGVTDERSQQGNEGVTSPGTPMSGGSRYGDGVKKASGPTLF